MCSDLQRKIYVKERGGCAKSLQTSTSNTMHSSRCCINKLSSLLSMCVAGLKKTWREFLELFQLRRYIYEVSHESDTIYGSTYIL